jgi:hypothetical protein
LPHLDLRSDLSLNRRRFVGVAGSATAVALLAGCGGAKESVSNRPAESHDDRVAMDYAPMFGQYEPSVEPDGDPSVVVWPDFVLASPLEIQELYAFHVTSGGLMRYMPCFCGCTGSGHRNNRDCYIREVHADGSVSCVTANSLPGM